MKRILLPVSLLLLAATFPPAHAEAPGRGYYGPRSRLDQSVGPEERRSLRRDLEGYGYPDREGMERRRQQMQEQIQERWRRADGDNDGSISRDEARRGMPGLSRRFERLDRDGDGVISDEEARSRRRWP